MKSIFISSTFKDMNGERDLVLSRVIPDLQMEARKYGENVRGIDLRWGVDTTNLESDEGSEKILDVCFGEIDRCNPYMLVFLGERYGWIPEEEIVRNALKKHAKNFEIDDYKKSVTALEIEYGMLTEGNTNWDKCVVCFRNFEIDNNYGENEETKQKLQLLKEKIRQKFGNRIIEYTGEWESFGKRAVGLRTMEGKPLEEAIAAAFLNIFQKEWGQIPIKNWIEQEERYAKAFYEKKTAIFRGREELVADYYRKVMVGYDGVAIHGEDGCGKSSLLCKVAEALNENGKDVFLFFSGISERSCTMSDFLKRAIYYLEEKHGDEHAEEVVEEIYCNEEMETRLRNRFQKLCSQLKEPIWFCVNALEQLLLKVDTDSVSKFLSIFPETTKVFFSWSDETYYDMEKIGEYGIQVKSGKRIRVEEIPSLTTEERLNVIEGITSFYGKTMSKKVILSIERKNFRSKRYEKEVYSPLYLDLIIKRLNMMDYNDLADASDEDSLNRKCIELVNEIPSDMEQAVQYVVLTGVNRLVNRFAGLTGYHEVFGKVLGILSFTREGITKEGMEYIICKGILKDILLHSTLVLGNYQKESVEWLLRYMSDFVVMRREGKVCFVNKTYRDAMYYINLQRNWIYAIAILDYIDTLQENDSFRMREGLLQASELIAYDTFRIIEHMSYKEQGEHIRRFLEKKQITIWWIYRRCVDYFSNVETYANPYLKKTMLEVHSDFYICYLKDYFEEAEQTWKVKRELLKFLLTEYNPDVEKLNNQIHELLLKEEEGGSADTELLLLSYERLKRRDKSFVVKCLYYSDDLYEQEKNWENARKVWEYCLETGKYYGDQYRAIQREKNPIKREFYKNKGYQEEIRKVFEHYLINAEAVVKECLWYEKSKEALELSNFMNEICVELCDADWIKEWKRRIVLLLEKQFAEMKFEEIYRMYEVYEDYLGKEREDNLDNMISCMEYVFQSAKKEKTEKFEDQLEKLEDMVCLFVEDCLRYSEETARKCRLKIVAFLRIANQDFREYVNAGSELKYIESELMDQIIEAMSISWEAFEALAGAED